MNTDKFDEDLFGDLFQCQLDKKVYQIKGFAIIEATKTHAVIYQDIESKIVLVRPTQEFFDGRFVFLGKFTE